MQSHSSIAKHTLSSTMKAQTLKQQKNLVIDDDTDFNEANAIEDVSSKEVQMIVLDESNGEGGSGGDSVGGGGGNGGGGSSSSSLPTSMPLTLKGPVRGHGPPPFLLKILEMVGDSNTNSIISWNTSGTSFIIWDTYKLCKYLLPKYFRHNNFSSFIYQLNNYGFKKINWDIWEYAHKEFQAGKEHLLKNIKRRNQLLCLGSTKPCVDSENFAFKSQLQDLRNDQNIFKVAIQKLQQKQQKMENDFATFKDHIQNTMCKQQKMVTFMANSFTPAFVQHMKEKRVVDKKCDTAKRQKFVAPENNEIRTTIQSDIQIFSKTNLNSEDYIILDKLVEDDLICGNELINQQSNIVMEFEDLTGKPADWGYLKELMEEMDCQESKPLCGTD